MRLDCAHKRRQAVPARRKRRLTLAGVLSDVSWGNTEMSHSAQSAESLARVWAGTPSESGGGHALPTPSDCAR